MRETLLMNRGWRYYFGQPEFKKPKYTSSDQQYRGSRAENARGPARFQAGRGRPRESALTLTSRTLPHPVSNAAHRQEKINRILMFYGEIN